MTIEDDGNIEAFYENAPQDSNLIDLEEQEVDKPKYNPPEPHLKRTCFTCKHHKEHPQDKSFIKCDCQCSYILYD
jgi:hypothetical protein